MSWTNITLILRRELRDQLRDRRTLFMIAVLPLLFYPLLGISFFQIAQFLRKHPSKILIIGHEPTAAGLPSLIQNDRLSSEIFDDPRDTKLVELEFLPLERLKFIRQEKWPKDGRLSPEMRAELNNELRDLMNFFQCEAVVCFPPAFFQELEEYPQRLREHALAGPDSDRAPPEVPRPQVVFDNSNDAKRLAHGRVNHALDRWSKEVGNKSLEASNLPISAARPIEFNQINLAAEDEQRIDTSLWSKVLPFVLMIWAVTGAFYPAVDLCAGEKERGTLETLLSSPARRSEIVYGKLLTIMLFSIATAMLNLVSMCITGAVVMNQLGEIAVNAEVGPPPLSAILWMSVILVPVAALFSAVCLALAAFARSTKEGQYYLMPVILVTMPLILLPMAPNAELNLGFSLIPVSGIVLLIRSMMEGTFHELWPYAFPVAAVTLACCWLAVRWAIEQFSSEEVLFREGERWDLGIWVRHLFRDREDTPTVAMAVLCGVMILIVRFFLGSTVSLEKLTALDFFGFFRLQAVTLIATVLTPALIMAFLLTRSPRKTLLVRRPPWLAVPAAGLLALALLPLVVAIQAGLGMVFPASEEVQTIAKQLQGKFGAAPSIWWTIALIALLPAVCEEFAYRGFILSGFRHAGSKWRAIVASSFFFGVTHAFMHQQMNAFLLGLVLGYVAVQTRSIWPPLVYHLVHNASIYVADDSGLLKRIIENDVYAGAALFGGTLVAVTIVFWFSELQRSPKPARTELLDAEPPQSLAGQQSA